MSMIPRNSSRRGYIIEFKVLQGEDKDPDVINKKLKKLTEEAIKQVEEKKYITELEDEVIKNITILGIVFKGKTIHISHKKVSL